jgi:hypothetical protein
MPSKIQGNAGLVAAAILILTLATIVVMGFRGVGPFPFRPRKLSPVDSTRVIKQDLYFVVAAIDAFQKRTGRLPKDLDEIGMAFDLSLSYKVMARNRYIISKNKYGQSLSFDTAEDARAFFDGIPPPYNPSGNCQGTPAVK